MAVKKVGRLTFGTEEAEAENPQVDTEVDRVCIGAIKDGVFIEPPATEPESPVGDALGVMMGYATQFHELQAAKAVADQLLPESKNASDALMKAPVNGSSAHDRLRGMVRTRENQNLEGTVVDADIPFVLRDITEDEKAVISEVGLVQGSGDEPTREVSDVAKRDIGRGLSPNIDPYAPYWDSISEEAAETVEGLSFDETDPPYRHSFADHDGDTAIGSWVERIVKHPTKVKKGYGKGQVRMYLKTISHSSILANHTSEWTETSKHPFKETK